MGHSGTGFSNTDCNTPCNMLQICFASVTTQYVTTSYRFDLGGRQPLRAEESICGPYKNGRAACRDLPLDRVSCCFTPSRVYSFPRKHASAILHKADIEVCKTISFCIEQPNLPGGDWKKTVSRKWSYGTPTHQILGLGSRFMGPQLRRAVAFICVARKCSVHSRIL